MTFNTEKNPDMFKMSCLGNYAMRYSSVTTLLTMNIYLHCACTCTSLYLSVHTYPLQQCLSVCKCNKIYQCSTLYRPHSTFNILILFKESHVIKAIEPRMLCCTWVSYYQGLIAFSQIVNSIQDTMSIALTPEINYKTSS